MGGMVFLGGMGYFPSYIYLSAFRAAAAQGVIIINR
jgi:hypothetical protein